MYTFIFLVFIAGLSISNAQTDYQAAALVCHNNYRANHPETPPLAPDANLNDAAVQCAQYYMSKQTCDHTCPYKNGNGENLASGSNLGSYTTAVQTVTDVFYNEMQQYDFNNPGFYPATGHFTQLMWKASTNFGCGIADDGNGNIYFCFLYSPPGNSGGPSDYAANVSPPRS